MISSGDFAKKQIVFVLSNQGEKFSFTNDNIVVRDNTGKIKFQCSCYRLFLVFVIGNVSITSGVVQHAKKFGFSLTLMTSSFHPYQRMGFSLEGNTLLRKLQYEYDSLELAKHITRNKILNQRSAIMALRNKNEAQIIATQHLSEYASSVVGVANLNELMGIEGCASRVYFPNIFNNIIWTKRMPRVKNDMVNTLLDIGYTMLFSFVEAILDCYGFDLYCGVMHRNFYMRKSLVCDLVEPFRVLIDTQIRKAINLKQCKEEDFIVSNGRYMLKWEKNPTYIAWLCEPIMEHKNDIHLYIQSYYRAFMKCRPPSYFPVFNA